MRGSSERGAGCGVTRHSTQSPLKFSSHPCREAEGHADSWSLVLRCIQMIHCGIALLVFPAKAGTHCVPRMALNLEVKVLFGPQGAEPLAKGNCVAAMRGGEEAGGKSGGRRTEIGYKAGAVGQPGNRRGRPILLPSYARVDPAADPRKCSVLPWEASSALRANRSRVSATASDGRGGVSRGHSSAHPWGRREGLNL